MLVLPRKVHDLSNFRFGNFERVHATDADTLLVDMEHDPCRLFAPLVEEALKDMNHVIALSGQGIYP